MRKFWTVVQNAGYGVGTKGNRENYPNLPTPVGAISYTVPGDIRVAEPTPGDGNHNHLVHGSVALPSTEAGDGHWHWIISKPGGGLTQVTVDGVAHNHLGELQTYRDNQDYVQPKYYLLLITCDDAEFTNLQSNGVSVYAERVASDDGEGNWSYAPLSTDAWAPAKRTTIENRLDNALGLALPSGVDSDKEFIVWLLDIGGWRPEEESKHT